MNRLRKIKKAESQFKGVPTSTICMSIQMLINELASRKIYIKDFDNKEKCLQQIQIYGDNIYFCSGRI